MKKNNLLLVLLFISVLFISCEKDENTENENSNSSTEELLLGKWQLTSLVVGNTPETLSECEKKTNFIFKADKTYVEEDFILQTSDNCIDDGLSGTWAISGNKLSLTDNGLDSGEDPETITYEFEVNAETLVTNDNDDGEDYIETYKKI